jgi:general secretion pathway protein F
MPLYAYKGIGSNGKSIDGVREADSPKALRQLVRKDGVVVTDVQVKKGKGSAVGAGKGLNRDVNLGELFSPVKKADVAAFTRHLATLLRAGIPLAECLGALVEQADKVKFRAILNDVRTAVNEGSSLADALAKHTQVFEDLYISMVRAGETAGNLDEVLLRLAEFQESAARLKSKVQGAMAYPVIMIVVAAGIMTILMVAVVPKITAIFLRQGVELPLKTRMLVGTADFVLGYWWLIIAAGIGAVVGFRAWIKTEAGRRSWDGFKLRAPALGPLLRQVAVARFARTTGTMLQSGVPMLRTLDVGKEVLGNVVLVRAIEGARTAVTEGESLANTLRKTGHFPPAVIHMVGVGERSGTLEQMLIRVADSFDQEVDMKLTRFTSLLEPLILVAMAGGVAFAVFAILEPLLEMQKFAGY